jgi:hypothetical protein
MQSEPSRYRARGWRDSSQLVDLAKAVPSDLVRLLREENAAGASRDQLAALLSQIALDPVSTLQHYRTQILYRLRNE